MLSLLKSWLKPLLVMAASTLSWKFDCHQPRQPRINILDLPPEVLRMIFVEVGRPEREYLPPNHHSAKSWFRREQYRDLCLMCSHFLGEARRLLFSEMKSQRASTHFKFLSTILRHPEYAAYVRIYHTPSERHVKHGDMLGKIRKALSIMYSLKELVVRESLPVIAPRTRSKQKSKPRILPAPLTAAAKEGEQIRHPFRLYRFVWLDGYRDPEEALEFLTTQNKLEYLGWGINEPIPPEYAEKISQKLIRLDAPTPVIEALLPGRRITELQWNLVNWKTSHKAQNAQIVTVLEMSEFKELRVLSMLDESGNANERAKRGGRLLRMLRKLDIGPFPKLEVLFNSSATLDGHADATKLVKRDAPYRALFPELKYFLMHVSLYDEHICLGSNYDKLPANTSFYAHARDMCENGAFTVDLHDLYGEYRGGR